MSTVALKGKLEFHQTRNEWIWKGSWAFGSSLDEATHHPKQHATSLLVVEVITPSRFLSPPISQPFEYVWREAADPSQVLVPSLNVTIIGGGEDEEEDEAEEDETQTQPSRAEEYESAIAFTRESDDMNRHVAASASSPVYTSNVFGAVDGDMKDTSTSKQPAEKTSTLVDNNNLRSYEPVVATTDSDEKYKTMEKDSKETVATDDASGAKVATGKEATSASPSRDEIDHNDRTTQPDDENNVKMNDTERGREYESKIALQSSMSTATKRLENEKQTKKVENLVRLSHSQNTDPSETKKKVVTGGDQDGKPENIPAGNTQTPNKTTESDLETPVSYTTETKQMSSPVTFLSVMEGFTDAVVKYKDRKCPPSGKWVGYFMNITGRNREKFRKVETQKVEEAFTLFMNATPSKNSKFSFDDAASNHIPFIPESSSDPNLVQIRGCGENEFGTFEIYGYLDLRSMVLEIQRQYVAIEQTIINRRQSDSSANRASRPYSTRKRAPSWKRKTYDPSEDTYGRKKRARLPQSQTQRRKSSGDESSATCVSGNIPVMALESSSVVNLSAAFALASAADSVPGDVQASIVQGESKPNEVLSSVKITAPTQASSATAAAAGGGSGAKSSGPRRNASGSSARTKRGSSKGLASTASGAIAGSSSFIRLPAAGDPNKARWRAAHFLYYQRHEPESSQQSTDAPKPNSPKVAQKPKYVIYEGELVDNKREGRGICLYSNGTMYEGEWKRDKEHGYGKLMTSDRRKTLYVGEWERGKIQGNGTYYYGSSDPENPGSRYVGEFKENLRNGVGRYYMPDGTIYDGQWREGVMNGRGVLTWPDTSVYDGEWKDGMRNGQGLLKCVDGFVYDGQWVNNAMEGRGLAIYPNGQQYEGLFSNGRREGRGTIHFTNGAVYEGRFRYDAIDGQGTMKMSRVMVVPRVTQSKDAINGRKEEENAEGEKDDFMIPISFQSDLTTIHNKAGFTAHGE